MEAQLKRISDGDQDVWVHDHESVRREQKCTLVEDCNSFEMSKMMVRTNQLLPIAEATSSKIYTRESEAETQWQGEDSSIFTETIPCPLLPIL